MTEQEWLETEGPERLLWELGRRELPRKQRLLCCALCRRAWHLLTDARSRAAVEASEGRAEGAVGRRELMGAQQRARGAIVMRCSCTWTGPYRGADQPPYRRHRAHAAGAAALAAHRLPSAAQVLNALGCGWDGEERRGERWHQLLLVRDVLGNPFRPVAIDDAWLAWGGGAVRELAEAAYRERELPSGELDPLRLAVLADALEDAGCDDGAILGHLRSLGPHVRGCHMIDALTGRA